MTLIFIYCKVSATSYCVYITQLIRLAKAFSQVIVFNNWNKNLTAKFLKQRFRYITLNHRKSLYTFYRRLSE